MNADPSEILGKASSQTPPATHPELLSVGLHKRDREANLVLNGELDIATSPLVEKWLNQAEGDKPTCVTLDLEQLTFMDCSGLRPLMQAETRACSGGWEFRLVNVGGPVRKVLSFIWPKILLDETPASAVTKETALSADDSQGANQAANGQQAFA